MNEKDTLFFSGDKKTIWEVTDLKKLAYFVLPDPDGENERRNYVCTAGLASFSLLQGYKSPGHSWFLFICMVRPLIH